MEYFRILEELTNNCAVSGYEERMSLQIRALFEKYCDRVEVDRFYNVIGYKKGLKGNKKILITAHYDEIGFLVKSIDENGFLKITGIGGIDSKILLAQEVTVHGKKDLFGVIGAKPPHLLKPEETKKAVKLEDLYIDLGFNKASVDEFVSIGSPVTLKANTNVLNGIKISSKALDNRASIASIVEILDIIKNNSLDADIYFVATTQEEFEVVGAKISAYSIEPDLCIVIDTCHGELPDTAKDEAHPLGKGPAIGLGPNMHRGLTNRLLSVAREENIPFEIDIEPDDSGTEAWVTQVARCGIPTVLVSIPLKYMHTAIETVHTGDIKNTSLLISGFISRIDKSDI